MTLIRVRETTPIKITGSPGATSASASVKTGPAGPAGPVGPPGAGADITAAQINSARDAAIAARDAAQAVGNTNDTIMASVAANAASSFASQLATNYVRGGVSAAAPSSPVVGQTWIPTSVAPTAAYLGGVRVYRSTGMAVQSYASSASTAVKFDTVEYDDAAYASLVANPDFLTIAVTGRYRIVAQVEWAANTTGLRYLNIFKNFATRLAQATVPPTSDAGSTVRQQIQSGVVALTANDKIQVVGSQITNPAVSLNVTSGQGTGSTFLCIERVA